MAKKYDYTNYELSEYEKEKARHRGNESISFDVFQNKVVELKDEKSLCVYVDDFFENENMNDIFAEDEGFSNTDDYLKKYYKDLLDAVPDYYESEAEEIEHQKEVISAYSQKFEITLDYYNEEQKEALTSALAGSAIKIPLGEGILDFCYADFQDQFAKSISGYAIGSEELWAALRKDKNINRNEDIKHEIKNRNQKLIETHMRYTDAVQALGEVMEVSLYSLINPPALINQNAKAYNRYQNYLINLQQEMLSLLEFCYDETYFPKLFGKMTPAERFTFYSKVNQKQSSFPRTEIFQLGSLLSASFVPITNEQLSHGVEKLSEIDSENAEEFAKKYNMTGDFIKMLLSIPSYTTQYYECSTVFDMLMLEFTKMLEHNIRFRKCKNCGRYFIMKGNYDNDYCDRIPEGETKNCQTIASLKNYKEKVSDNVAWKLYNKYYKRYFARMKAGNIESDVFKKWQYKATAMRDECVDGKVTEQEFEDFLFGSFVNRKRS
ncbi:MAG: DUF6076 domain-containing protein [Bacteroidaceae bacterium]|nr:DUF6076 domain-containing protein [Bacteroidaceae bacterium]